MTAGEPRRAGRGLAGLPKKHAAKPDIPYLEAVEEALGFGWID